MTMLGLLCSGGGGGGRRDQKLWFCIKLLNVENTVISENAYV
jgi:hypothetical protein